MSEVLYNHFGTQQTSWIFFSKEREREKKKGIKERESDERCSLDEIKKVNGKSPVRLDRLQLVWGLKMDDC